MASVNTRHVPLTADDRTVAVEHSTLSWRAIFAGTLISLLTYFTLLSLGLAIGSSALQGVLQGGEGGSALGWGTGLWFIASVLVSLFVGAYAASRVSGLVTTRIGRVQGAVITALFFGFMLSQVGSLIGLAGKGVGSVVGAVSDNAGDIADNPQVQATVDDALGDLNLRSDPRTVAQGVGSRLLRGDSQGAKTYLAREAGISPADADQRINSASQKVQAYATQAAGKAAQGAKIAGWSLFGALVLGTLVSMFGGGLGAGVNLRAPLSRSDSRSIREQRAA
jgi:hypothetical protein